MKKLLLILISLLTIGTACTAGCTDKKPDDSEQKNGVERSVEDECPDCDEEKTDKLGGDFKKAPRMPHKPAPHDRLKQSDGDIKKPENPKPVPMPHPNR